MAKIVSYEELTEKQKRLLDEAEKAMNGAYNPYSKFSVGAAVMTNDGKIITGTNVENAVYGETVCAERVAILRANAMGHRNYDAMAIITPQKTPSAPCGGCRQVIYEFSEVSEKDIEIIDSNKKKDKILVSSIGELLPFPFGPKRLGVDIEKYKK